MTVRSPLFVQALSYPAQDDRLGRAGQWVPGSGALSAYSGVIPGSAASGTAPLSVAQNGTPNMSVNVTAGAAVVQGTENALQGAYQVVNDATVNLTISAANPTNPRRDLIALRVRDAAYSGASNDATLVVVTGTPAASPVDPTLPTDGSYLVLARVAVAAAAASVTNANVTDLRPFTAARGGIVPDGNAPGMYIGQHRDTLTRAALERWDGTRWVKAGGPPEAIANYGRLGDTTVGSTETVIGNLNTLSLPGAGCLRFDITCRLAPAGLVGFTFRVRQSSLAGAQLAEASFVGSNNTALHLGGYSDVLASGTQALVVTAQSDNASTATCNVYSGKVWLV